MSFGGRILALCLGIHDLAEHLLESLVAHSALVLAGAVTDRDGLVLDVAVAHHQHVGDLLQGGLADLLADLLVAQVHLRTEAGLIQLGGDLLGVLVGAVGDGEDLTCTGESQVGKAPAKCSVMTPMKRSMEPSTTR